MKVVAELLYLEKFILPTLLLLSNYEVLSWLDITDSSRVVLQEHLSQPHQCYLAIIAVCARWKNLTRLCAFPILDQVIIVLRGVLRKQERMETALSETHLGCPVTAPGPWWYFSVSLVLLFLPNLAVFKWSVAGGLTCTPASITQTVAIIVGPDTGGAITCQGMGASGCWFNLRGHSVGSQKHIRLVPGPGCKQAENRGEREKIKRKKEP